jgi:hypothetical protein
MLSTGQQSLVIAGVGKISMVKESTRTSLDTKLATALLEANKLAVPLNISSVKANLRIYLNV